MTPKASPRSAHLHLSASTLHSKNTQPVHPSVRDTLSAWYWKSGCWRRCWTSRFFLRMGIGLIFTLTRSAPGIGSNKFRNELLVCILAHTSPCRTSSATGSHILPIGQSARIGNIGICQRLRRSNVRTARLPAMIGGATLCDRFKPVEELRIGGGAGISNRGGVAADSLGSLNRRVDMNPLLMCVCVML